MMHREHCVVQVNRANGLPTHTMHDAPTPCMAYLHHASIPRKALGTRHLSFHPVLAGCCSDCTEIKDAIPIACCAAVALHAEYQKAYLGCFTRSRPVGGGVTSRDPSGNCLFQYFMGLLGNLLFQYFLMLSSQDPYFTSQKYFLTF